MATLYVGSSGFSYASWNLDLTMSIELPMMWVKRLIRAGPTPGGQMSSKQKPTKPIAVFTRVSEQGRRADEELHSHDIQRRKIEGYLASHDLTSAREKFEDTDVSGRKMSRPSFDRAIDGIRSGTYGGIAVARLSRFGRKTSGILELIYKLEDLGAAVIVLDPPIDTSTAAGRAMLTVFSAFVTMEAEQAQEQAGLIAVHGMLLDAP